jgi:precorrin-3B synthase
VRILDAAGLADTAGGGPHRPCVVSPLAGFDPQESFDSFALACAIDERLGADQKLAALPAKFGILVDGGGRLSLEGVSAHIRVVPAGAGSVRVGTADEPRFHELEAIPVHRAAEKVHALARALASRLAQSRASEAAPHAAQSVEVGAIEIVETFAVIVGLAFGRCGAGELETLAGLAEALGSREIRTAPWRALAIPGVGAADLPQVLAAAEASGFVVSPDDPRLAISACPGRPACANAQAPTLEDAKTLAPLLQHLAPQTSVHLSGCAKGCARKAAADLTLVGDSGGYRVVLDGNTSQAGLGPMRFDEIVARLATGIPLRSACEEALP